MQINFDLPKKNAVCDGISFLYKKRGAAAPLKLLLQALRECRSSFELNNLLGWNIQFGTGTRVANNSCASLLNFESTH